MTLTELKRQGFVPRETASRMNQTLPGALADAIDRILYSMQEDGPEYLKVKHRQYIGRGINMTLKKPYPMWGGLEEDGQNFDVCKTLRAVYHYLEACALKEALQ